MFEQPSYPQFTLGQSRPRYRNPSMMQNPLPQQGMQQAPSRPTYTGFGMGQGQQGQQQNPSYPSFNDPTLAAGAGAQPFTSQQFTPPDGAMAPPMQFQGGTMPNWMYAKGWRSRKGEDGKFYWFPPGAEQGQAPSYSLR